MAHAFTAFAEEIEFTLPQEADVLAWLSQVLDTAGCAESEISYIFCSDEYLLALNQQHLEHNYYTDILTFPYAEDPLMADVFISIDRVKENAEVYHTSFEDELHRVMVHGVLHLLGLDDHGEQEQEMRKAEDKALSARQWK